MSTIVPGGQALLTVLESAAGDPASTWYARCSLQGQLLRSGHALKLSALPWFFSSPRIESLLMKTASRSEAVVFTTMSKAEPRNPDCPVSAETADLPTHPQDLGTTNNINSSSTDNNNNSNHAQTS